MCVLYLIVSINLSITYRCWKNVIYPCRTFLSSIISFFLGVLLSTFIFNNSHKFLIFLIKSSRYPRRMLRTGCVSENCACAVLQINNMATSLQRLTYAGRHLLQRQLLKTNSLSRVRRMCLQSCFCYNSSSIGHVCYPCTV